MIRRITIAAIVAAIGFSITGSLVLAGPASAANATPATAQGTYASCYWAPWTPDGCNLVMDQLQAASVTRMILAPSNWPISSNPTYYQGFSDRARARGIRVVWNLPYRGNLATAQTFIQGVRNLPATHGYYIADEPGQLDGEVWETERQKVAQWAGAVKSLAPQPSSNSAFNWQPTNYTYSVHFACSSGQVDAVQKPYLLVGNIDFVMIDCYPYGPLTAAQTVAALQPVYNRAKLNVLNSGRTASVAFVGQAFAWDSEPGGSPNGLTGWPPLDVLKAERDCGYKHFASEYYWFAHSRIIQKGPPNYWSTVATAIAQPVVNSCGVN